ncbi:uncharacterized protein LOC119687431 isoform X2 [Teleopsis dalmanni]|uniref:uncharacterized protein LOC119687431 isoform X2 n=1 Tax=Teleopsis dalmanni TaxID=139649 RepID=UPI0018CD273A|nr:uncharacterized protein LOC119687431 isoform X2 [Teleopsis dalmanni]
MTKNMEQPQQQVNTNNNSTPHANGNKNTSTHGSNLNDGRKFRKSPDFQPQNNTIPAAITRERSFVRTSNQQNINKRRSLALNIQPSGNQQGQMRGKPAMDIYRPPKLNYNLQHSSSSSVVFPVSSSAGLIPQSKSSGSLNQQVQFIPGTILNRRQALSLGGMTLTGPINAKAHPLGHRPILVTHSHPMQLSHGVAVSQVPLINSPSSGNILNQTANTNRVKFAVEPQKVHKTQNHLKHMNNINHNYHHQGNQQQQHMIPNNCVVNGNLDPYGAININPLQRSKSLSSADALTRGIAGLGLALGNEITDIGQFSPEIQTLIDTALDDPNKLNSRCLMELTSHFIKRTVEGRRYALPISRLCLNIIAKEQKETFLEALLNTCRQWYQEREKLLYAIQGMKSPSRVRFTAFMAFLTEMFCQLKRRQLQLRTQCEGASPPLVLLTLLSKCCESCVKPPVRSLSEIECLFYVLTCIGQDMEVQLPQQLETLLSLVRDAFLNSNDSAPSIRRTLLQLIELQASHWQLAGNTVLYYYPSAK